MIALIFFGIIALVMLYQMFNLLGRNVGFQADKEAKPQTLEPKKGASMPLVIEPASVPSIEITNLDKLKAKDPSFDPQEFLLKSRDLYEKIVLGFNQGDMTGFNNILAQKVLDSFTKAIASRQGEAQELRFVGPVKTDFDAIDVDGDKAILTVRFLCEIAQKQDKESGLEVFRRTAELWTFERLASKTSQDWIIMKIKGAKP